MTDWTEVLKLDALGQAELVRRGEISALELTEAAIGRCEALNSGLNAVITPLYDQARERAADPLGDGPFAGVPFLLKDLLVSMVRNALLSGQSLSGRLCLFPRYGTGETLSRNGTHHNGENEYS